MSQRHRAPLWAGAGSSGRGGFVGGRCDHAGVAGRRKRRRQSEGARQRRAPQADRGRRAAGAAPGGEEPAGDSGGDQRLDALWEGTRSGAWAGRGFYFQHAVGAWLAASVAAGRISARVVPEGFEDVSLEDMATGASLHVQAKSRGEDSGLFTVHEAATHILDAWERHLDRAEPGAKLAVVFERGVRGEILSSGSIGPAPALDELLPGDSKLRSGLRDKCVSRGMTDGDAGRLLSSVAAVGVTWEEVEDGTAACVGSVVDLPPSSLRMAAYLLVGIVARASADNAPRNRSDRRRLHKSEIVGEIQDFAAQIDVESLEAAVGDGVCEPFRYSAVQEDGSDRFYEGAATQPFHVAAGLVVRRSDLIARVLVGLRERSAVVITGPSGVGKSRVAVDRSI